MPHLAECVPVLPIQNREEPLIIYYREKNGEEAGLIKIYEYKTGENVKIFEEKS